MNFKEMHRNEAIFDCLRKTITLLFRNQQFELDMSEGNLENNYNGEVMDDGTPFDVLLQWEREMMITPKLFIYEEIDPQNLRPIEVPIIMMLGTKQQYFE